MQQHDNPALAKIRKLLAKAEDDAATPAEAELYTAKPGSTDRHGRDEVMVVGSG